MIAAIRIVGLVGQNHDVKETLHRLRLRRKYALTILKETPENLKLIKKVRNQIAYGTINPETLVSLIEKRAELKPENKGKKIDAKKLAKDLETKNLTDLEIKPFFRLHPPRGGIDAKKHFGVKKGVLGDHKEKINDLIGRML